jgi:ATP-dependent RNA helicase DeaD
MRMPTPADVAGRRKEAFKERLRRVVAEQELELYLTLVEELVGEGLELAELAAGAAWLAGRERPLLAALEPDALAAREAAPGGPTVRLHFAAGRRAGVRPADLVGALANEGGVPGPLIGAIDVHDRFSLVEVPAELAERAIERMARASLRGRPVAVREAAEAERALPRARLPRDGGARRPGRPAGGKSRPAPRGRGGAAPKKRFP